MRPTLFLCLILILASCAVDPKIPATPGFSKSTSTSRQIIVDAREPIVSVQITVKTTSRASLQWHEIDGWLEKYSTPSDTELYAIAMDLQFNGIAGRFILCDVIGDGDLAQPSFCVNKNCDSANADIMIATNE